MIMDIGRSLSGHTCGILVWKQSPSLGHVMHKLAQKDCCHLPSMGTIGELVWPNVGGGVCFVKLLKFQGHLLNGERA